MYRFANAEFDPTKAVLRVAGKPVAVERRPLRLLEVLLAHANEVVTKEELFESVWDGRPTVEHVLTNAVSKLRVALGPLAAARVVTVPRTGYRLVGPVQQHVVAQGSTWRTAIGQAVPGAEGYCFERPLGNADPATVWLGRHAQLGLRHVFKFATEGARLSALKREYTLNRVLQQELGPRDDIARIVGANFSTAPYFLQCEPGGQSLLDWAAEADTLATMSMAERVGLFLQIARAVAAAHSVGVLHKDLKPGNVLIERRAAVHGQPSNWQIRLIDFGSGRLLDPSRLDALRVTALGLTQTQQTGADSRTGTPLYLAPELLAGQSPTTHSDVYALGVMLFQLLAADLRRPMASGWQRDIGDALLVEDVAAATDGDPGKRLGSATELVERLDTLQARRVQRDQAAAQQARAAAEHAELMLRRSRRPWLVAAFAALTLALIVSLWSYGRSLKFLREARSANDQARQVTEFLHRDVLEAPDVVTVTAVRVQSMLEVMRRATRSAQARFKGQPRIEAAVLRRLAQTYLRMASLVDGSAALDRAIDLLAATGAPDDPELLICRFLRVRLLVWTQGHAKAAAELAQAEHDAGQRLQGGDELAYEALRARHVDLVAANDRIGAQTTADRLVPLADALFAPGARPAAEVRFLAAEAHYQVGDVVGTKALLAALERPPFSQPHVAETFFARHGDIGSDTLLQLAERLAQQNDYVGAARTLRSAREREQRLSDPSVHALAWLDLGLGSVMSALGDWTAARSAFETTLSEFKMVVGEEHQYTRTAELLLASAQVALGKPEAALLLYDGVARWRAEHRGYWPWDPLLRFGRAVALTRLGRANEALSALDALNADDFFRIPYQQQWPQRIAAEKGLALIALGRRQEGMVLLQGATEALAAAHGWPSLITEYRRALSVEDRPSELARAVR